MNTNPSVKTITEIDIENKTFSINCFSDKNSDGTTFPNIYQSKILDSPQKIDNAKGIEGELMLSATEDGNGVLNSNGELIITVESEDDVNKYAKENENLMYNG